MIGRIHIELDKSEQEAVDFLKKSKVVLKHKLPFSGTVQQTASFGFYNSDIVLTFVE